MGGGELARDFLKDDVVDELYIGIVPVLIGEGIPLFPSGFPQREFSLLENKSFSKGLIALKYGPGASQDKTRVSAIPASSRCRSDEAGLTARRGRVDERKG